MNEKEKFRAEIDAKLKLMSTSLDDLTAKWEIRKENRPDINLKNLAAKKEQADTKLKELDQAADEDVYRRAKSDITHMMNDIDDDLRSAMAYLIN